MESRMLLLSVVLVVLGLWSSSAQALAPMGPPVAGLEEGQFSAGFDLSYSEMDVEVSTGYVEFVGQSISETLDNVESLTYLANLGYGIADNWEAFIRLGLADAEFSDFKGSTEFAYGFGTKVTFREDDPLSWGGLFQITWVGSDGSLTDVPGFGVVDTDPAAVKIDFYEIQLAVGPTYKREGMRLYGGPFLHFIKGDLDMSGVFVPPPPVLVETATFDVEQESEFGGYIGAQFDISRSASWNLEYQLTGDGWAISTGIVWRF